PVHVDLTPDVRRAFEGHDDALLLRQLNDFHRVRRDHHSRSARRQTVAFGVVLTLVLQVVVVDRRAPRHRRHPGLRVRARMTGVVPSFTLRFGHFLSDHAVAKIRNPPDVPDALFAGNSTQIWSAVCQPRCRGRWFGRSGRCRRPLLGRGSSERHARCQREAEKLSPYSLCHVSPQKKSTEPVLSPNRSSDAPNLFATDNHKLPISVRSGNRRWRRPRPAPPPAASIGSGSVACTLELPMPLP